MSSPIRSCWTGLRTKRPEIGNHQDVNLTEKELTVLKLMCSEKTTKEIADIVDISPRTVEAIRDKLKTKTGAKSMAGLVMYAVKNGIIEQHLNLEDKRSDSHLRSEGRSDNDLKPEDKIDSHFRSGRQIGQRP